MFCVINHRSVAVEFLAEQKSNVNVKEFKNSYDRSRLPGILQLAATPELGSGTEQILSKIWVHD